MVTSTKKVLFIRPQVIKLRFRGKSYSEITSIINNVNGNDHQITETVNNSFFIFIMYLIRNITVIEYSPLKFFSM